MTSSDCLNVVASSCSRRSSLVVAWSTFALWCLWGFFLTAWCPRFVLCSSCFLHRAHRQKDCRSMLSLLVWPGAMSVSGGPCNHLARGEAGQRVGGETRRRRRWMECLLQSFWTSCVPCLQQYQWPMSASRATGPAGSVFHGEIFRGCSSGFSDLRWMSGADVGVSRTLLSTSVVFAAHPGVLCRPLCCGGSHVFETLSYGNVGLLFCGVRWCASGGDRRRDDRSTMWCVFVPIWLRDLGSLSSEYDHRQGGPSKIARNRRIQFHVGIFSMLATVCTKGTISKLRSSWRRERVVIEGLNCCREVIMGGES